MNRTASRIADPINEDDDDGDRGSMRGSRRSGHDVTKLSLNKTTDTFKFELPPTCYISMMKKVLIEKHMQHKYVLASHPYPKLEGEMIVFKPKKED